MKEKKIKNKLICLLFIISLVGTLFNMTPMQSVFAQETNEIEVEETNACFINSQTTYAASSSNGTWVQENNGRWWYKHNDGSYTKYDWEYIDGNWYFFDKNGWMWTEWLEWNDNWYYFKSNGIMKTGWLRDDDKWYYFDNNGKMQTGWIQYNSNWYYLNNDGSMRTGWVCVDNKWHYLNANGTMRIGWLCIDDIWYYLNDKGVMQTDWEYIEGSWYYFHSNGRMNTAPLTQGSRKYAFYSSGKLYSTEILIVRQKQKKSNWCWAASSVMVGTYNTNSNITQYDAVKFVKGSEINEGGTDFEAIQALNYSSNFTKSGIAIDPLNFKEAVNYIDKNKPFEMHISWNSQGGHMIVCAGYNLENGRIRAIDPWRDTKTTYYDYDSLINGTDLLTGTGTCTSMIVY